MLFELFRFDCTKAVVDNYDEKVLLNIVQKRAGNRYHICRIGDEAGFLNDYHRETEKRLLSIMGIQTNCG